MDTPPDTPAADVVARDLAERTFSAYAQQAKGPLHPQHEQSLLTRLAEAGRPLVGAGSTADLVSALNGALDAFEQAEPEIRGPRLATLDRDARTVTLA